MVIGSNYLYRLFLSTNGFACITNISASRRKHVVIDVIYPLTYQLLIVINLVP